MSNVNLGLRVPPPTVAEPERVLRGTKGADQISIDKLGADRFGVTINGEQKVYSKAELERLTIDAGRGDDRVRIGEGVDAKVRLRGGRGADTFEGSAQGARLAGGRGQDTFAIAGDGNTVRGGRGADRVEVEGDGNRVRTGRGADAVSVEGDGNRVRTGRGADAVFVRGDFDRVHTGRGADLALVVGDANRVRGGRGADTLLADGLANHLHGGPGHDRVATLRLRDLFPGGAPTRPSMEPPPAVVPPAPEDPAVKYGRRTGLLPDDGRYDRLLGPSPSGEPSR